MGFVIRGQGHGIEGAGLFGIGASALNNKMYGNNGDDEFYFWGTPSQDVWGGMGSDTYTIPLDGLENSSLVIHDFDVSSPESGGDRIVFYSLESDFNLNTMNLALTQSSTATDHYLLTADEGTGRYTTLTLIGTNLSISDLADNISSVTVTV